MYASLTASHAAGPSTANCQRKESHEAVCGQSTKLCPCVQHAYLYISHFLNHSTSFFFFCLSKWSSSMGYKVMESSSGWGRSGWLPPQLPVPRLPRLGIINGTMTGSQISKECSLRGIFPIEARFLFCFQHCSLNIFLIWWYFSFVWDICCMCIWYKLIFFIAFFPVAYWVAGFFFVVFVLFCFWFFKQWNVSNFISSAFNKF